MISVQTEDFDVAAEYAALRRSTGTGAAVMFSGLVRDTNLGDTVGGLLFRALPRDDREVPGSYCGRG